MVKDDSNVKNNTIKGQQKEGEKQEGEKKNEEEKPFDYEKSKKDAKIDKEVKIIDSEEIAASGKLNKDFIVTDVDWEKADGKLKGKTPKVKQNYGKITPGKLEGGISRPSEPFGHFNFRIELEGIDCGAFKSVDGIGAEIEEIEYQYGHDLYASKMPGRRKFNNIKLSKGYIASDILWSWFQKILEGTIERKSGSIILLNDEGREVLRYNFYNAWPRAWNGFKMDGKGNEILVEDIELVTEYLEIKK